MMQRNIEKALKKWQSKDKPHPLLVRGARQIGKSYTIEKFARENFKSYLVINFDEEAELKQYFEDLDVQKIIDSISIIKNKKITKGETLIFLDEIQECPKAIQSLRYFYEKMPGLHIIGAGSLLEFTLRAEDFKVPVGRIHYYYMQPMSFYEFLVISNESLLDYVKNLNLNSKQDSLIHKKLIEEVKKYMILGGLPEVVDSYFKTESLNDSLEIQSSLIDTYKDDFGKYSKGSQYKYLDLVFDSIPKQVSQKFMYSNVDPDIKTLYLKDAFHLLTKANLAHKIKKAIAKENLPNATASEKHFKALFLDIGLMHKVFGMDLKIILDGDFFSHAAGGIAEQFVGQELLTVKEAHEKNSLYYWATENPKGAAEIDYLINFNNNSIPLEVKAGTTGSLKSLLYFMEKYQPPIGLRVSAKELSLDKGILSVPFYAIPEMQRLVSESISKVSS